MQVAADMLEYTLEQLLYTCQSVESQMFWVPAGKQKEAQRLDGTINASGVVEVAPVFVEEQVMTVIRLSWGA